MLVWVWIVVRRAAALWLPLTVGRLGPCLDTTSTSHCIFFWDKTNSYLCIPSISGGCYKRVLSLGCSLLLGLDHSSMPCAVPCRAALCVERRRVDSAIQQFTPYLTAVAQTGQCDTVKEARLLQLIADNSLLYTDVVTKIGLLDISPTAWKHDK